MISLLRKKIQSQKAVLELKRPELQILQRMNDGQIENFESTELSFERMQEELEVLKQVYQVLEKREEQLRKKINLLVQSSQSIPYGIPQRNFDDFREISAKIDGYMKTILFNSEQFLVRVKTGEGYQYRPRHLLFPSTELMSPMKQMASLSGQFGLTFVEFWHYAIAPYLKKKRFCYRKEWLLIRSAQTKIDDHIKGYKQAFKEVRERSRSIFLRICKLTRIFNQKLDEAQRQGQELDRNPIIKKE